MRVLDKNKSLRAQLLGVKKKAITIVSAFAVGTEDVVDGLLKNGNEVELIVGTINSFTSPNFISCFSTKQHKSLSFYVDFRYEKSIHWKLYLVSPNRVIIGSANFTGTGLDLIRDTCVSFVSEEVYEHYFSEIEQWKKSRILTSPLDERFEALFDEYKESHRQAQTGRNRNHASKKVDEWLVDEANQTIPVFVWETKHDKETIIEAKGLLQEEIDGSVEEQDEDQGGVKLPAALRQFFVWRGKEGEKFPYCEGDVVLCLNDKGSYPGFYTFDIIKLGEDCQFMFCLKNEGKKYFRPFQLGDAGKKALKELAPVWLSKNITHLGRKELNQYSKLAASHKVGK